MGLNSHYKCVACSNTVMSRPYAKGVHGGEDRTERGQDREKQTSCGVLTLPSSPCVSVQMLLLALNNHVFPKGIFSQKKTKKHVTSIAVFNMKDFYQFKKTFKKVKILKRT